MLGVPPGQNLDHGRRRQVDNTAVFAYPATNPQTPGGPTMDLQILTTISTGVALAALVWTLSRGRSEVRTHMGKIRQALRTDQERQAQTGERLAKLEATS